MRLEQWSLVTSYCNVGNPKEPLFCRIKGEVYGNPLFDDGQSVVTSLIIATKNGKVVTYSDSQYELGDPDPTFQKTFPFNAKETLIKSLPVLGAA